MNKGKSSYIFTLNCDPQAANQVIGDFLNAYNFKFSDKFGESAYYAYDAIYGNRGFQYSIRGNEVLINAFVIGMGKKFYQLEGGAINIACDSYRTILKSLFDKINQLGTPAYAPAAQPTAQNTYAENPNAQGFSANEVNPNYNPAPNVAQNIPQNGAPNFAPNQAPNAAQFSQSFSDEANHKKETMCEVGFWISIVGTVLSLFGIIYGVIIYLLDFYFAIQGMKTRKRGKAIATIVLSCASIAIVIIEVIVNAMDQV